MSYITKLNDEIIDSICSPILSAKFLYENDKYYMFLYSYLLLKATGIERLQKIVFVLKVLSETGMIPDEKILKNLGHRIDEIHKNYLVDYFNDTEKIYFEIGLKLLTEIVNIKRGYRYVNFDFKDTEPFMIQAHVVKILNIKKFDYTDIKDSIKLSWNILDLILKKYTAILIDLIRRKEIGNGEIVIIPCLLELSSEKFLFLDLNIEIEKTIAKYKDI